ncbi:MAG TPA: ABC transporter permease subunit [Nocardioidaceae bacterium]|nr:ABC transporter permease subunit [Nocardioidaceae bacterium]
MSGPKPARPSLDLARIDLRLRRRSLIGYAIGMAIYAFVIVALYPTFKDDAMLDEFTQKSSKLAALFGASGSLTSPPGWLNANLYGNFVPLIILLLTIGYGAHAIAGQDEDLTLGLAATLPVSRLSIVLQKFAVMCLVAVPVSVVTMLVVLAGRHYELPIGTGPLVGITVGAWLLGVDFGVLALLLGSLTGNRGLALGVTSAVAAAAYLISSLAPAIDWLRPARFASPFYWAVGNGQVVDGLGVGSAVALVAVAVVLLAASCAAFSRLDVH